MDTNWSFTECIISEDEISMFAVITNDWNALHFGPDRIAHGALIIGRLSAAITNRFGNGTMALGESRIVPKRPVRPNELFTIGLRDPELTNGSWEAEVIFEITKLVKDRKKTVMSGEIKVVLPKDTFPEA